MAVKIRVEVFWVVMLHSIAVGYKCSGGPCCLNLHPESGVSEVLQTIGYPTTLHSVTTEKTSN